MRDGGLRALRRVVKNGILSAVMVDVNKLKQKFPAKKPGGDDGKGPMHRKSSKAAVKAIAREYERKMSEVRGAGPAHLRKGPLFYGVIILVLVVVGGLVLSAAKNGVGLGKARIERQPLQARKSMAALAVALGRYKFHVGSYPTTEEGLYVLAFRKPDEIRRIRRAHPGWDGPYVDHIVDDPWGHAYVYETRPEGGNPILYSKGADGRAGTTDDVLPDPKAFEIPFHDTTWTNGWAPCELRGVVVAPDEETRKRVREEMKKYDRE